MTGKKLMDETIAEMSQAVRKVFLVPQNFETISRRSCAGIRAHSERCTDGYMTIKEQGLAAKSIATNPCVKWWVLTDSNCRLRTKRPHQCSARHKSTSKITG